MFHSLGFVHGINAFTCGNCSLTLVAGRQCSTDLINHAVGLELCVSIGDNISEGKKEFCLKLGYEYLKFEIINAFPSVFIYVFERCNNI